MVNVFNTLNQILEAPDHDNPHDNMCILTRRMMTNMTNMPTYRCIPCDRELRQGAVFLDNPPYLTAGRVEHDGITHEWQHVALAEMKVTRE